MTSVVTLLTCLAFCAMAAQAFPGNQDMVHNLPGLPHPPSFKQYSGYLNGMKTNKLHYWFVEAVKNPSQAPLLLWLNGGPGCSSLDGLLSEHGPFAVKPDGKTLYYRPTSWNKFANVLYLESPAGVGFSYNSKRDYIWDDDTVAMNNYVALKDFFRRFPQFVKNEFFITGESYGGIYVPTLTLLAKNDSSMNLKGFAVGNGMSSYRLNDDSLIYFGYYHGLFGTGLWKDLQSHCCTNDKCNFHNPSSMKCVEDVSKAMGFINNDLDVYNVYADCFHSTSQSIRMRVALSNLFRHYKKFHDRLNAVNGGIPCVNGTAVNVYLNSFNVKKALHIPSGLPPWSVCNLKINVQYRRTYQHTITIYPKLITTLRGLLYNGDIDMACNFLMEEWSVDSLNLTVTKPRQAWYYNDFDGKQVGGYVIRYKNFDYATVRGSGHMAPQDKPVPTFQLLKNFIFNKPYSTPNEH